MRAAGGWASVPLALGPLLTAAVILLLLVDTDRSTM